MGLFNLLSTDDFNNSQKSMKEEILMAIKDVVTQLRADIASAADRVVAKLDELDTLRADRDRLQRELDDLRASEDAEDVAQNEAFAAKQAEVDAKAAEIADAETELRGAAEDVAKIGSDPAVVEQTPDVEAPVEVDPEVPGPADQPVDGEVADDAAAVQDGTEDDNPPAPPAFV